MPFKDGNQHKNAPIDKGIRNKALKMYYDLVGYDPDVTEKVCQKYSLSESTLKRWLQIKAQADIQEQFDIINRDGKPNFDKLKKIAWMNFIRLVYIDRDWQAIMAVLTGKVTATKPPAKGKAAKPEPVSREAEEAAEAFGE